jgi:hypothetical protein
MAKKKRTPKDRTVAVLTLRGAGALSAQGRRDLARWLRNQANDLLDFGHEYAGIFRARRFS